MHSRPSIRRFYFSNLAAGVATLTAPAIAQPCSHGEVAKLTAADGTGFEQFGISVSISDNTAVIGSYRDGDNGPQSGSAYIFRYDGTSWTQEAKLLPTDGASQDYFGGSVSISGDTAVIGAAHSDDNGGSTGSAYVFRRNGTGWVQEAKLLASDGGLRDEFGSSVSVSGNTALIGARGESQSGSAYVFYFNGTEWVQEAKLFAADATAFDEFGYSVSIAVNTAVIGAWGNDDNGAETGSAYVFRFDGSDWSQEAKLLANDGESFDRFGYSVSILGDSVVIGATQDGDNGNNSGSVYLYKLDGAGWILESKLLPTDGTAADEFGYSVSLSGGVAFIGAHHDDDNGTSSGSAYIFDLNCIPPCLPDVNGDDMLSPADFSAWVTAFNAQAPECDQNGDGACTPADFSAWVANYNLGC